jgi:hypothetical protein
MRVRDKRFSWTTLLFSRISGVKFITTALNWLYKGVSNLKNSKGTTNIIVRHVNRSRMHIEVN